MFFRILLRFTLLIIQCKSPCVFHRVRWSHRRTPTLRGEGKGTMSNKPSGEYRIMQRHLSPSCVRQCCISLLQTRGVIFHNIWFSWDHTMVSKSGMWNEPHTMVLYPPLFGLLPHTNQSVLLFLTHHHFHDLFFSPFNAQQCGGQKGGLWCQWPFHPQRMQKPSKSLAGVTWPVEIQAAGVEKLRLHDSSLIPFSPDTRVGLGAAVKRSQTWWFELYRHVFAWCKQGTSFAEKFQVFLELTAPSVPVNWRNDALELRNPRESWSWGLGITVKPSQAWWFELCRQAFAWSYLIFAGKFGFLWGCESVSSSELAKWRTGAVALIHWRDVRCNFFLVTPLGWTCSHISMDGNVRLWSSLPLWIVYWLPTYSPGL